MNALVKFERSGFTEDGLREYTFTTSSRLNLNKDKSYDLNITETKPKRSLAQNAMWHSLLNKICLELDGNLKDADIYHNQLMDMAGVESRIHYVFVSQREYEKYKNLGTNMKVISKKMINHVMYYNLCIYDSSRDYNKAEMAKLIDVTLDYAAGLGIETEYWKDLLSV